MSKQQQWDEYMLGIADAVAKKSKDPNSKLGAVLVKNNIVVATGFNGFPRGIDEGPERWIRPTKYAYVSHAESNAIHNAARLGVATEGTALYLSGFPGPCIECAKGIIQAGIIRVAWWTDTLKLSDPAARAKWEADLTFARGLLTEAGVIWTDVGGAIVEEVCNLEGEVLDVFGAPSARRDKVAMESNGCYRHRRGMDCDIHRRGPDGTK